MMNPEIKDKWVAALRSGEYKQGVGFLREHDAFCCLGVLCDIHSKETGTTWELGGRYLEYSGILPPEVCCWSGIKDSDPVVMAPAGRNHLAAINDGGTAFREIADIIEAQL